MNKKKTIILCSLFCLAIIMIAVSIKDCNKEKIIIAECVQQLLFENDIKESCIVNLADYQAISYNQTEYESVTKEEVEFLINLELDNHSVIKKVNRSIVEDGDYIYFDYTVYSGGNLINCVNNDFICVGRGDFNEMLEEAMIGSRVDEEFIVELNISDDRMGAQQIGKIAEFHIYVKSINEYITPEVTNEFVKNNYSEEGLKTAKEFFDWIKKLCQQNKDNEIYIKNKNNIINELIAKSKFEIKKEEIGTYSYNIYEKYERIAYIYGYNSVDRYYQEVLKLTEDEFFNMCYIEGEREIKEYLLIGAIAVKENMMITNEELEKYCIENGEKYTENMNETIKNVYMYNILQNKIYKFLMQNFIER